MVKQHFSLHFFLIALAALSFFQDAPVNASEYDRLSIVEKIATDEALKKFSLIPATQVQGKKIGKIYIDIIDPILGKTIFTLLNRLHSKSRDFVVLHDILLEPGSEYSDVLSNESELLLKAGLVRSVAVIIPVLPIKDPKADEVDLLVVTRDLFGWRFESDFSINGGNVDLLKLGLEQNNLLGLNKRVGATFLLLPQTIDLSVNFTDSRLTNSWHQLQINPGIMLQRYTGEYAGVYADASFSLPLYSQKSEWGYGVSTEYYLGPEYTYEFGNIKQLKLSADPQAPQLAAQYNWLDAKNLAWLTRSYGGDFKTNVRVGYGFHIYRPDFLWGKVYTQQEQAILKEQVFPASEYESYASLGFHQFWNSFYTIYNYNTFMLGEIVRLGPNYNLELHLGLKYPLFSENNFFRYVATANWTWVFKDALLKLAGSASTRFSNFAPEHRMQIGIQAASPSIFGVARLVVRADYGSLINNRLKEQLFIAGDTGLRGLPSFYLPTNERSRVNVELRSSPFRMFQNYMGLVAFYDGASLVQKNGHLDWRQSVGLGARFLSVEFNTQVFRFDLGFPIEHGRISIDNARFSLGYGQAFE